MLFILAMNPLQKLMDKATEHGISAPIGVETIRMRTSLYADNAALFIRPTVQDLNNVQQILAAFEAASGLHTKLAEISYVYDPTTCYGYDTTINELQRDGLIISNQISGATFAYWEDMAGG
jgi:hypothetical protein